MTRRILCSGLLAIFPALAQQQEVKFQGPVTGWIQDPPTHSIRLLSGMPGAALLGRQLLSDVEWASTAPGASATAVALRNNGDAALEAVLLRGDSLSTVGGASVAAAPTLAVWSADATSVVLVWTEARSTQRIRIDADGHATADALIELANLPETGAVTAAAVSAGTLYFAIEGSGIYRLGNEGAQAELLSPVAASRTLLLNAAADKLWTVDHEAATLLEISTAGGEASILLSDADVLSDVSALQISPNRQALYIANASTRKLHKLELASLSLAPEPADLDVAATAMTPLSRASVFVLGARRTAEEPLYLWDESSARIFFVPAAPATVPGEGQ